MTYRNLICAFLALSLMSAPAAAQGRKSDNESTTNTPESDSSLLEGFFDDEPEAEVTSGQDSPDINEVQSELYDGPKARIAVARFTDKTGQGWYSGAIGEGMADQLATALFQSNRFILLERQTLNDVLFEQDLASGGRVSQQTAAPTGQIEGAELLVTGAVTEFQGNTSGGGGFMGGILGAVSAGFSKTHMAIDVRIIDTKTSRIVAATSVEGEATDVDMGAALVGYTGGGLSGGLGVWKNTPIEKALRITINKAVEFISTKTPPIYYREEPAPIETAAAAIPIPVPQPAAPSSPDYVAGTIARVSSSKLNVRGGPGKGHGVVFGLAQGQPLLVMTQSGDWVQIKTQTQQVGWVAGWLIYPDASMDAAAFATPSQPVAVEPQADPAPAEPAAQAAGASETGDADDIVARLKKLDKLRDLGIITDEEYQNKRLEILSDL